MTVLVVGAGPAGLAIAACLKREGVPFELVDRSGQPGGAYRNMYAGITLLSPAVYTQLPGYRVPGSGEYVTAAEYRQYLADYVRHHELDVTAAEISAVERSKRGFHVRYAQSDDSNEYANVVVATGMFDCPHWPEVPGLSEVENPACPDKKSPPMLHARDWRGASNYAGSRILVIGGGMSGVEIAEESCHAGLDVTVASRRRIRLARQRVLGRDVHHWVHTFSHLLPRWALGSFCDRLPALPAYDRGFRNFVASQKIDVRPEVRRFHGNVAEFVDGTRGEFDVVVCATGYRFHVPFLPDTVARGFRGQPLADEGQSRSCAGLYFVGMPCSRLLVSEFLRGIALDAPIIARRIRQRSR